MTSTICNHTNWSFCPIDDFLSFPDDWHVGSIETSAAQFVPDLLTDRRATDRFPLNEPLHYRVVDGRGLRISGEGRSLNMSSGGLYFSTEQQLPVGRNVEISVNWPARLENNCPLKFVATGKVVRSEALRAAIRIERYEFRTRAANPIRAGAGL